MRIRINFSKNNGVVNIVNQHLVNGYIHKCLGYNNKYHDAKNDYSISSLMGGKLNEDKKTLTFENGGFIVVSSINEDIINDLLMGLLKNVDFIGGMKFVGILPITEEFYNGWNYFATLSPFIIKEYVDKKTYKFITLTDDAFESKVKSYLINKISKILPNEDLSDFDVSIPKHDGHKVKKIMIKNVINKANQCQIHIKSSKRVAELLYNIGIGQSTGSGFGVIYKNNNKSLYV